MGWEGICSRFHSEEESRFRDLVRITCDDPIFGILMGIAWGSNARSQFDDGRVGCGCWPRRQPPTSTIPHPNTFEYWIFYTFEGPTSS